MGLGKRLIDLARSNLNSLLEKAADVTDPKRRLSQLSDEDLESELARRRAQRLAEQKIDDAKSRVDGKPAPDRAERERMARERETRVRAARAAANSARTSSSSSRQQQPPPRSAAPPPSSSAELARWYERLELPAGSDLPTVKTAYRRLMRKYHPDMHVNKSPDKQKAAHEVAQALTQAYTELEKALGKK